MESPLISSWKPIQLFEKDWWRRGTLSMSDEAWGRKPCNHVTTEVLAVSHSSYTPCSMLQQIRPRSLREAEGSTTTNSAKRPDRLSYLPTRWWLRLFTFYEPWLDFISLVIADLAQSLWEVEWRSRAIKTKHRLLALPGGETNNIPWRYTGWSLHGWST